MCHRVVVGFVNRLFQCSRVLVAVLLLRKGDEPLASPEAAEELPHVGDQEVGDFHSGEVAAFVELRPMGHGALGVHHTPEDRVGVEDRRALRHV
jgi:hypothetical protein